jgi:hypothetical protein
MRGISLLLKKEDEANRIAPKIIEQKKELEEEKKKDTLSRKLSLRPTKGDLKQKNILRGLARNLSRCLFGRRVRGLI